MGSLSAKNASEKFSRLGAFKGIDQQKFKYSQKRIKAMHIHRALPIFLNHTGCTDKICGTIGATSARDSTLYTDPEKFLLCY
jgi:hypothetical protein